MKKYILMTGATGLIGQRLVSDFLQSGFRVTAWVRDKAKAQSVLPQAVECISDLSEITHDAPFDMVINLAGKPIASGLWTSRQKQKLLDSRVNTTRAVLNFINKSGHPPKLFIQASACGIYGDGKDTELDETGSFQDIFLSQLCQQWESVARDQTPSKTRLVILRLGVVLANQAPAFNKLVTPVKFGMGAVLGSGEQYFPWVHIDDVSAAISFIEENTAIKGALNLVAPNAVTQREFTATLAKYLNKPLFLRVPAWALKAAMGELSDLFLKGQRAVPKALVTKGYTFRHPTLKSALTNLLG